MYNNKKLSLKSFHDSHSFGFIKDSETIRDLIQQMLKVPMEQVFHPSTVTPKFDPREYLDYWFRDDGILGEGSCLLTEAADMNFGDMLLLLREDLNLPGRQVELKMPRTDGILKMYCMLYRGYIPDG